ncbi:hypothetical protein C7438_1066 [Brockia lithotrophica]|uniref:Uncharacterized protein n=1 Tax=Brockia lithotrophica TaxID=933949 RepID=A0A660L146_9BACL|nr:hypothetical protein C7438_1066 [Brockia lithotrophica]
MIYAGYSIERGDDCEAEIFLEAAGDILLLLSMVLPVGEATYTNDVPGRLTSASYEIVQNNNPHLNNPHL